MTQAPVTPDTIRLVAYTPDGAFLTMVEDYDGLECKRGEYGQGDLSFSLPETSDVLTHVYSGSTGYARALSNYRFELYYWGALFFEGIAVTCDDDDEEAGGSTLDDIPTNVVVSCVPSTQWLGSGRLIMGTAGVRYTTGSVTADDGLKGLWRAQCVAASIIEPTAYGAGVLDPTTGLTHSIDRENFGPFTVAIAADTSSHSETGTWRWDHGRSLWDNTLEHCRRYDLMPTVSWSGTTCTINFVDAAGSDLAGDVVFSRERENLRRFSRKVDRMSNAASVAECRGFGRRGAQIARYAMKKSLYDDVGVRETTEVWRSASGADAENNVAFIIHQVGGAETTYEAELSELDDQKWGDFDRGDRVTIHDSKRGITVEDYISELELTHDADDIPELRILTGRPPLDEDKKGGRSGGGHGGGGSRGGGPPKNADGETFETLLVAGDCITIAAPVEDEDDGTRTYTVATSGKSFGPITVDDGTLTPSTCWQGLEILGDRCIEVLKTDADTITIRNSEYWIHQIVTPAATYEADACDFEVEFENGTGIAITDNSGVIRISTTAALNAYTTINGNSGSATAASATDTLNIVGGDGILTTAANASPDRVTSDLRLPATTAGSEVGALRVWNSSGTALAVKVYQDLG